MSFSLQDLGLGVASLRVGVGSRRPVGVGSRLARGVCSRRVGVASRLVGVGSRLMGAPRSFRASLGISTSCLVGVGSRRKGTSRLVGVGSRLVGVGSRLVGVGSRRVGVGSRRVGVACRLVGVIASLRVLGSRFGVASRPGKLESSIEQRCQGCTTQQLQHQATATEHHF